MTTPALFPAPHPAPGWLCATVALALLVLGARPLQAQSATDATTPAALAAIATPATPPAPGPAPRVRDDNGAVRYLNAVGHLQPFADEKPWQEQFRRFYEEGTDPASLAAELRDFLGRPQQARAFRFLRLGAACPRCDFTPDNTGAVDDDVPPLRQLRRLMFATLAKAWLEALADRPGPALDLVEAVFTLGQQLAQPGPTVPAMIGVALGKAALTVAPRVLARCPAPAWRERVAAFLARFPRPLFDPRGLLTYERDFLRRTLGVFRQGAADDILRGMNGLPPTLAGLAVAELAGPSATVATPAAPAPAEAAASETASDSFRPPTPAERAWFAAYIASPRFASDTYEAIAHYDAAIALAPGDPELASRAAELDRRAEASRNWLLRDIMLHFANLFRHQQELERLRDALPRP